SRARRAARGELAHLAIGMNDIGARHPGLARAVAGFSARFPEVHLEFAAMVSRDQVAALEAGRIDAAVLVDRPRRAGLAHLALGRDPFVLALPAGHPLAALDPVPVAALAAERFVSVAMAAYRAHQTRLWLRCGEL